MTGVVADWTGGEPRFILAGCDACNSLWYLPRENCPYCGSREATPRAAAGTGLCVGVTRLHVTVDGSPTPRALVLVELDEGPLVMGRTHDDALAPGDRAVVEFRAAGHGRSLVPSFSRKA